MGGVVCLSGGVGRKMMSVVRAKKPKVQNERKAAAKHSRK
jgi:hypothetical protein